MRRYLVIFVLILLVSCGGDDQITGGVVNTGLELINSTNKTAQELGNSITGFLASAPEKIEETLAEKDLLKELEDQQTELMLGRAEIIKQKRETLDNLINPDNTFEDRQLFQKALDILREKESELTLAINRMESRIKSLTNLEENQENLESLQNTIKDLEEQKDEYMRKIKDLGETILKIRSDWLNVNLDEDMFDDFKSDIKSLEKEESKLMNDVVETIRQLNEKKEIVASILGDTLPDDDDTLLVERARVEQELNVIENIIFQEFIKFKQAEGEEKEKIDKLLYELGKREDDLQDELNAIDKKLGY